MCIKKESPTYSTTSNVFANDVHRTSSPMLNRPLAFRSLPIEFAYPSSVVVPIPARLLEPKLKDPVPDPDPIAVNAKRIRKILGPFSHPTAPAGTLVHLHHPKIRKFLYFTPELSKRYRQQGIHTPSQPIKSILVRLNRPHLAPFVTNV